MDSQNIFRQFFRAVFHELFRSKTAYNILASVILLSVVAFGYLWQESYVSKAAISIAQRNASGSSAGHLDALISVYDTYSFQQKMVLALDEQLPYELKGSVQRIDYFKHHSQLTLASNNVVHLSFASASPSSSQAALTIIMQALLDKVQPQTDSKALVLAYENLQEKDGRLLEALQSHQDKVDAASARSTEPVSGRSRNRIASIAEALQDVEVNISALNAKIAGIRRRLQAEDELYSSAQRLQQMNTQKQKLNAALAENINIYSSSSPEVISIQQELDNVNVEIISITENQPLVAKKARVSDSLYEQLRQQLTLEEIEKESMLSRQASLARILSSETKKADVGQTQVLAMVQLEKVQDSLAAEHKAVLNALERNLREQKRSLEKSTHFIVLDVPNLPQTYSGLGFVEFLIMGPLLSFGLPFGAASLLVLGDSRIRTSRQLKNIAPAGVAVLGVIPHYNSPKTLRVFRKALLGLVTWGVFVFIVYFTVGVIGLKG